MNKAINYLSLALSLANLIMIIFISNKIDKNNESINKEMSKKEFRLNEVENKLKIMADKTRNLEIDVSELYALDAIDKSYNMKIDKIHNNIVELKTKLKMNKKGFLIE